MKSHLTCANWIHHDYPLGIPNWLGFINYAPVTLVQEKWSKKDCRDDEDEDEEEGEDDEDEDEDTVIFRRTFEQFWLMELSSIEWAWGKPGSAYNRICVVRGSAHNTTFCCYMAQRQSPPCTRHTRTVRRTSTHPDVIPSSMQLRKFFSSVAMEGLWVFSRQCMKPVKISLQSHVKGWSVTLGTSYSDIWLEGTLL